MADLTSMVRYFAVSLIFSGGTGVAVSQEVPSIPVALELVLAIDTSASVDSEEFRLQIQGIADAFRDADVVDAIEANGADGIAVVLMQWSSGDQQKQSGRWHRINDSESADRFATAVENAGRLKGNTTAIGSALQFARRLFRHNGFSGNRNTIDVSGDGRSNSGIALLPQRDLTVASGVSINGLAILDGDPGLKPYYERFVVGGSRAFVIVAKDFEDFGRAIRQKLLAEINPVFAKLRDDRIFAYQSRTTFPELPDRMASNPD